MEIGQMEAEWRSGPDFAEVAEALQVRTDQIMAMVHEGRAFAVLYTPDPDNEPIEIWRALLQRGSDDVLVVANPPIHLPGLWEDIVKRLEAT